MVTNISDGDEDAVDGAEIPFDEAATPPRLPTQFEVHADETDRLLGIAERAIEAGEYADAEITAKAALLYLQDHATALPPGSQEEAMLRIIAEWGRIREALEFYKKFCTTAALVPQQAYSDAARDLIAVHNLEMIDQDIPTTELLANRISARMLRSFARMRSLLRGVAPISLSTLEEQAEFRKSIKSWRRA